MFEKIKTLSNGFDVNILQLILTFVEKIIKKYHVIQWFFFNVKCPIEFRFESKYPQKGRTSLTL
jgi:hypothetical protein